MIVDFPVFEIVLMLNITSNLLIFMELCVDEDIDVPDDLVMLVSVLFAGLCLMIILGCRQYIVDNYNIRRKKIRRRRRG